MAKNRIITVQNIPITVSEADLDDYICITDMASAKAENSRAADVVRNWLRNRSTLEFLATWEEIYNLEWNAKRFLSKNNYLIQTDAVKNYLIPACNYREELQWLPYAEEIDLLNVALFGFYCESVERSKPGTCGAERACECFHEYDRRQNRDKKAFAL